MSCFISSPPSPLFERKLAGSDSCCLLWNLTWTHELTPMKCIKVVWSGTNVISDLFALRWLIQTCCSYQGKMCVHEPSLRHWILKFIWVQLWDSGWMDEWILLLQHPAQAGSHMTPHGLPSRHWLGPDLLSFKKLAAFSTFYPKIQKLIDYESFAARFLKMFRLCNSDSNQCRVWLNSISVNRSKN